MIQQDPMIVQEEPPPNRRGRQILILVVLAGLVVVVGANWLSNLARGVVDPSSTTAVRPAAVAGLPVEIVVPPGSSARSIGALLADAGVVESGRDFELAARRDGVAESLAAGTYQLQTGLGIDAALAAILAGPEFETFDLLLREGLRIDEVIAEIASQTPFDAATLEADLTSGAVSSSLLPAGKGGELVDWEGLLFPALYDFDLDVTSDRVLQRLADEMVTRVGRLDLADMSRYEALVTASIIEAETRVDADRPLVASVINNRLEQGIPLQIDATILYAMGERGIGLTLNDLEIDSPFNTYRNLGLPPAPIGVPGQASLDAVADPEETDFIYYVLTSADGSHSFTADYNEFLEWKDKAKAEGLFP